jgi:drug/metabolite transporter (DMT)-like permease
MIVAFVLVSALLHALWNALLRLEPDKDRGLVAAVAVATVLAAAVATVRALAGETLFASLEAVGWALAAGVLEWLYFASLARALDRGPLGPIYTVSRGGAILVVWPVSIAWLGEHVSLAAAIGSAIVLGGLVLASVARSGDTRAVPRNALAWAIACACAIAGYHVAYKAALAAGGSPSAVFALALALATAINVTRTRGVIRYARGRTGRVLVMGVVCGGSFLILLEGLAAGGAGYVLTLRNTSVLFATLLAFAIGERPRRGQITGAILVALGAVLMAWP